MEEEMLKRLNGLDNKLTKIWDKLLKLESDANALKLKLLEK